jgi:hypothetical protein
VGQSRGEKAQRTQKRRKISRPDAKTPRPEEEAATGTNHLEKDGEGFDPYCEPALFPTTTSGSRLSLGNTVTYLKPGFPFRFGPWNSAFIVVKTGNSGEEALKTQNSTANGREKQTNRSTAGSLVTFDLRNPSSKRPDSDATKLFLALF